MSNPLVADPSLLASLGTTGQEQLKRWLETHFGTCGSLTLLPGEADLNAQVTGADGKQHLLKVSLAGDALSSIETQLAALRHLAQVAPELPVSRVVPTTAGRDHALETFDGKHVCLRLLTWLPGTPALDVEATPATRQAAGRLVARLDRALAGFFHPGLHDSIWDLRLAADLRDKIALLSEAAQRSLASEVMAGFDEHVAPRIPHLPRQMLHNDVNHANLLQDASTGAITGLLDFGDMVHSSRINEVAVLIAHQLYRQDDVLQAGADLLSAYVAVNPLEAVEIDCLFDLVCTRLLSRELISAWRSAVNPSAPPYSAKVSGLGWAALHKLWAAGRERTRARWFAAAGLPLPRAAQTPAERDLALNAMVDRRSRLLGPLYKQFYQQPFFPVQGEGVRVTDDSGRVFLDGYNNVPHVGHCHPHVVAAVTRQLKLLNTHTRYLHDTILDYAEKLSASLPDPLNVCLFVCSGTEANELAWRIACANSGGDGAVITESAFHGNSTIIAELDSSTLPPDRLKPWVATVPAPAMAGHRPDRRFEGAEAYAHHFTAAVEGLRARGHRPSALFTCPVFASDGLYSPPAGYLDPAMAALRAAGTIIISDEVQSGLGRPGTHMWGFQHAGFTPDIVTMGKPMGNGLPLGVVVTRRELLDRFVQTQRYFNTFGGNPVACAAGLAVLEVVEREGLQANALEVGAYLRQGLADLMARHTVIGDVRGSGLFIGVEMVEERGSDVPSPAVARAVIEGLLSRSVMIGTTGPQRSLLKIRPPMVFSRQNADELVGRLDETLSQLRR